MMGFIFGVLMTIVGAIAVWLGRKFWTKTFVTPTWKRTISYRSGIHSPNSFDFWVKLEVKNVSDVLITHFELSVFSILDDRITRKSVRTESGSSLNPGRSAIFVGEFSVRDKKLITSLRESKTKVDVPTEDHNLTLDISFEYITSHGRKSVDRISKSIQLNVTGVREIRF